MYETFKRFSSDSLFAARGADLSAIASDADRARRALEELARSSPYWDNEGRSSRCSCAMTWCAPRSPASWKSRKQYRN